MSHYFVFVMDQYYPQGGFNDMVYHTDDREDAENYIRDMEYDRQFQWVEFWELSDTGINELGLPEGKDD